MISVIIPFYNVDKYISKTLDSLKKQTLTDWEAVLIDDGSTDKSGEICDFYSKEDSRFRVIHKEHAGVSAARNAGLDEVRGEYIYFLDGDDLISENCFELLYNALIKNDADMAQGNFAYVNDDMTEYEMRHPSDMKNCVITGIDMLHLLNTKTGFLYVMSCNKLCKKSIFDDIRYPEGKIHEDHFAAHRIAYNCKKIACIADKTYFYIKHGGSITMKRYAPENLTREEAVYDRCKFLESKGLNDLAAETALVAIKVAPRVIQKCLTRGFYNDEVEKRLNGYFVYEYGFCRDLIPAKKFYLKIVFDWLTKSPKTYVNYLKFKYRIMPEPKD